ncbi:hypothetical protein PGH07_10290 [Sulfurovum sp. zt1-1]|uniref:Class I SAM-dependent methyltransferase n=1 Tax=Sulfurovum zhangzhouensis TaxID=3019067 RepID=A0ABT7R0H1_9BACT|nr:hypothetical protein [Sulfurovum zhangzhouensis]MDM5272563.1 hypothetical protein [Sulfurovum zhangzhouensis]
MKQIELDKLQKLLQIIGPYPSTSVVHFSDNNLELSQCIYDYCHAKSYHYQINATDKAFCDQLQQKFDGKEGIRIIDFSLRRPKYLIQGKHYEFLFVTLDLPVDQRDDFLHKAHEILRNSGNILLFVPHGGDEERYSWERLLEKNYYVATNTIDDLFEHYDVIISKKMHGWGDK